MSEQPFPVEMLDRQVILYRAGAPVDDGFTTVAGDPVEAGRFRAQRTDVSDGERMAAAQQGGAIEVRFLVRSTPLTRGVLLTDQVECEGLRYQVTGNKEATYVGGRLSGRYGRSVAREITAARVR